MKVLNFIISQTQYLQAQCTQIALVFVRFVRLCLRSRFLRSRLLRARLKGIGFVILTGLVSPAFADTSTVIDLHKAIQNQASESKAEVPTQAQIQSGRDTASRFLLPDVRDEYGVPEITSHPPLPSVEERVNKLTAATEANLAKAQIVLEQMQKSLDGLGVGIQLVGEQADGSFIALDGIDDAGRLLFLSTTGLTTQSLDAAKTVSADQLWSGGSTGYNLDGTGRQIGISGGDFKGYAYETEPGVAIMTDEIPEPTTYALFVGILSALALVIQKRFKTLK